MVDAKEAAGRRAAQFVEGGMRLGLGTGSTVRFALLALAERIRAEGLAVCGVPTSLATEREARELGIPLVGLDEVEELDLAIDGADEVDPGFHMTKGGGGALLREKVVASISRRVVIAVVEPKLVPRLGATFPLPVEVVPFARPAVERAIARLGAQPVPRTRDGKPYVTDNGNWILDCRFARGIDDAADMERRLDAIPGVVETGLFIGLAHVLVVGRADGTTEVRVPA